MKSVISVFLCLAICCSCCFASIEIDRKGHGDFVDGSIGFDRFSFDGIEPVPMVSFVFEGGFKADIDSFIEDSQSLYDHFSSSATASFYDAPMTATTILRIGRVQFPEGKFVDSSFAYELANIRKWDVGASGFYSSNDSVVLGGVKLTGFGEWYVDSLFSLGGGEAWNVDSIGRDVFLSYDILADVIGKENVRTWSYPDSGYSPEIAAVVGRHFDYGVLPTSGDVEDNLYENISTLGVVLTGDSDGDCLLFYGGRPDLCSKKLVLPMKSWDLTKVELQKILNYAIDLNAWIIFYGNDPYSLDLDANSFSGAWTTRFYNVMHWVDSLRSIGKMDVVTVAEGADRLFSKDIRAGADWFRNQTWSNTDSINAPQLEVGGEAAADPNWTCDGFVFVSNDTFPGHSTIDTSTNFPRFSSDLDRGWLREYEIMLSEHSDTEPFRIVKVLPGNSFANVQFTVRVDTTVEADATDETFDVYVSQYSLPVDGRYSANPDSIIQYSLDGSALINSGKVFLSSSIDTAITTSDKGYDIDGYDTFWADNALFERNIVQGGGTKYHHKKFSLWFYVWPEQSFTSIYIKPSTIGIDGYKTEFRVGSLRILTYPTSARYRY
jgi:hypothetical protein